MAAYRQIVPLRGTTQIFRIDDGTMCRMPSPLPGPLRGEFDPLEIESNRAAGRSLLRHSVDPFEGSAPLLAFGNAA